MFQEQANQRDLQALVERVLTSSTLTRKGGSEKGLGWGPGPWSAQQNPLSNESFTRNRGSNESLARNRGFKETRILIGSI